MSTIPGNALEHFAEISILRSIDNFDVDPATIEYIRATRSTRTTQSKRPTVPSCLWAVCYVHGRPYHLCHGNHGHDHDLPDCGAFRRLCAFQPANREVRNHINHREGNHHQHRDSSSYQRYEVSKAEDASFLFRDTISEGSLLLFVQRGDLLRATLLARICNSTGRPNQPQVSV